MAAGSGRNDSLGYGGGGGAVPPTQPEMHVGGGVPPTVAEGFGGPIPPTEPEGYAGQAPPTEYEDAGGGGGGGGMAGFQTGPNTVLAEEESKPLSGWLVVLRSRSMPLYKEVPIFKGANTLGKSPHLGVHMIADTNVSGQHAVIVGENGVAQITDLGSTNGTMVNRQQVRSAALTKGTEVKLGKTTFVFVPLPVDAADAP